LAAWHFQMLKAMNGVLRAQMYSNNTIQDSMTLVDIKSFRVDVELDEVQLQDIAGRFSRPGRPRRPKEFPLDNRGVRTPQ